MILEKTLDNGNKVFSTIEREVSPHAWDCGAMRSVSYHVEIDGNDNEVRKWQPNFEELAGHSPASKKFGH